MIIAPVIPLKKMRLISDIKTTVIFMLPLFVVIATAYDYDANDFATEVVSYTEGSGVSSDSSTFPPEPYNHTESALGGPTIETTGDFEIGFNVWMPVVPVYPAWRWFEIVTVGTGGELVLKFNHRISDDDNNLHGIDFIVFGNARCHPQNITAWKPEMNPETVYVDSGSYIELGIVSVSQDDVNYYSFATGPFADDFAPTAAYVWDDFNDVWGRALDPTRPVDPNLTFANMDGNSVAEVIEIYDGAAGGTGFDLRNLAPEDFAALDTDPNTGRKWIMYVKIEDDILVAGTPEIDAVSDVSCDGDYKNPYPVGDLTKDHRVDLADTAVLFDYWLAQINGASDPAKIADIYIDNDDIVNLRDLALLEANWTEP